MDIAVVVLYLPALVFLIAGLVVRSHSSEFPDVSVGYHSAKTVESKAAWEEANRYAGAYCVLSGLILLSADFILMCFYLPLKGTFSPLVWAVVFLSYLLASTVISIILLIVLTSHHIKRFSKLTNKIDHS